MESRNPIPVALKTFEDALEAYKAAPQNINDALHPKVQGVKANFEKALQTRNTIALYSELLKAEARYIDTHADRRDIELRYLFYKVQELQKSMERNLSNLDGALNNYLNNPQNNDITKSFRKNDEDQLQILKDNSKNFDELSKKLLLSNKRLKTYDVQAYLETNILTPLRNDLSENLRKEGPQNLKNAAISLHANNRNDGTMEAFVKARETQAEEAKTKAAEKEKEAKRKAAETQAKFEEEIKKSYEEARKKAENKNVEPEEKIKKGKQERKNVRFDDHRNQIRHTESVEASLDAKLSKKEAAKDYVVPPVKVTSQKQAKQKINFTQEITDLKRSVTKLRAALDDVDNIPEIQGSVATQKAQLKEFYKDHLQKLFDEVEKTGTGKPENESQWRESLTAAKEFLSGFANTQAFFLQAVQGQVLDAKNSLEERREKELRKQEEGLKKDAELQDQVAEDTKLKKDIERILGDLSNKLGLTGPFRENYESKIYHLEQSLKNLVFSPEKGFSSDARFNSEEKRTRAKQILSDTRKLRSEMEVKIDANYLKKLDIEATNLRQAFHSIKNDDLQASFYNRIDAIESLIEKYRNQFNEKNGLAPDIFNFNDKQAVRQLKRNLIEELINKDIKNLKTDMEIAAKVPTSSPAAPKQPVDKTPQQPVDKSIPPNSFIAQQAAARANERKSRIPSKAEQGIALGKAREKARREKALEEIEKDSAAFLEAEPEQKSANKLRKPSQDEFGLNEALASLPSSDDEKDEKIARLESELEKLKSKMQEDLVSSNNVLKMLQERLSDSQFELMESKERLAEKTYELSKTEFGSEEKFKEKEQEIKELTDNIASLMSQNARLGDRLTALEDQSENIKNTYKAQIKSLQEALETAEAAKESETPRKSRSHRRTRGERSRVSGADSADLTLASDTESPTPGGPDDNFDESDESLRPVEPRAPRPPIGTGDGSSGEESEEELNVSDEENEEEGEAAEEEVAEEPAFQMDDNDADEIQMPSNLIGGRPAPAVGSAQADIVKLQQILSMTPAQMRAWNNDPENNPKISLPIGYRALKTNLINDLNIFRDALDNRRNPGAHIALGRYKTQEVYDDLYRRLLALGLIKEAVPGALNPSPSPIVTSALTVIKTNFRTTEGAVLQNPASLPPDVYKKVDKLLGRSYALQLQHYEAITKEGIKNRAEDREKIVKIPPVLEQMEKNLRAFQINLAKKYNEAILGSTEKEITQQLAVVKSYLTKIETINKRIASFNEHKRAEAEEGVGQQRVAVTYRARHAENFQEATNLVTNFLMYDRISKKAPAAPAHRLGPALGEIMSGERISGKSIGIQEINVFFNKEEMVSSLLKKPQAPLNVAMIQRQSDDNVNTALYLTAAELQRLAKVSDQRDGFTFIPGKAVIDVARDLYRLHFNHPKATDKHIVIDISGFPPNLQKAMAFYCAHKGKSATFEVYGKPVTLPKPSTKQREMMQTYLDQKYGASEYSAENLKKIEKDVRSTFRPGGGG